MLNQKTLLMSATILSALALTTVGCGKSNESRARKTQEKQVEAQATDEGTLEQLGAPPLEKADDVDGKTVVGLPRVGSEEESQLKESSTPLAKASSLKVLDLKFDEAEAIKTGGKLDNLNFTSSSDDGLMAEFRGYNKKQNKDQQELNLNLAKAIMTAKLVRVGNSADVVELTLDESMDGVKKITSYKLKATLAGDKYSLSKTSANGDLDFEDGFLKCIDRDGGCESAYIKIKMSGGYARIIFRNSLADRLFVKQDNVSSAGYDLWMSYIMNTVNFAQTNQKIKSVQLSSFEVVNGRSGMVMMLLTEDGDLVSLGVPLLTADKGTEVSVRASKLSDSSGKYSQKLSAALKEATLINNNGKGDLRLRLDLSGQSQAFMWLTLSRISKATMSIAEIQGFESKK